MVSVWARTSSIEEKDRKSEAMDVPKVDTAPDRKPEETQAGMFCLLHLAVTFGYLGDLRYD